MSRADDRDRSLYGSESTGTREEGDNCGEAVMAAMQAISDNCSTDGVPIRTGSDVVAMVPKEEMETVENMAPEDMTRREMLEFIEDSPWLREWAGSLCETAGLSEGTREFEDCLINYMEDVVGE